MCELTGPDMLRATHDVHSTLSLWIDAVVRDAPRAEIDARRADYEEARLCAEESDAT